MTYEIAFVLIVAGLAIGLFASGRLPPDLVAVGVLLLLFFGGAVTTEQALSGFANPAVITIGAVFVISRGLARTGVAHTLGRQIRRVAGQHEAALIILSIMAVGTLSGFMSAVGAAAVLLPAVVGAAREMNTPISRVLLPLAYGAIIGNMLTLVGTPANLLVDTVLTEHGLQPFGLFEFTPFGAVALAAGTLLMVLTRRWLLPSRPAGAETAALLPVRHDQHQPYRLEERLFEVTVPEGSDLAGRTLREIGIGQVFGISVLAINRDGKVVVSPLPDTTILRRDYLVLSARAADMERLLRRHRLIVHEDIRLGTEALHTESIDILEAVLAPRSELVGQTLAQIDFRERFGLNVLGIWREGAPRRTHLGDMVLGAGDALLLQGSLPRLAELRASPEFVVLTEETGLRFRRRHAPLAIVVLIGFIVALVLRLGPVAIVSVAAAAAMVAGGALRMDEALASVNWRAILLIAAMLPMAAAMRASGAANLLADGIISGLGSVGPWAVLLGILGLTFVFTHVMSNHVAAVLMTPIAIGAASGLSADPRMFALAVALAASTGFMMPQSHPASLLVMGPGNYRFSDYVRLGLPLGLLTLSVTFGMLLVIFRG